MNGLPKPLRTRRHRSFLLVAAAGSIAMAYPAATLAYRQAAGASVDMTGSAKLEADVIAARPKKAAGSESQPAPRDRSGEESRARQAGAHLQGNWCQSAVFDNREVLRLKEMGISVGLGTADSFLQVNEGSILFTPQKRIAVGVELGVLYLSANAVAYVIKTRDGVAIYDLHQDRPGDIKVSAGGRILELKPGRQLLLTRQMEGDIDGMPETLRSIRYRNATSENLEATLRVFNTDFSISVALATVEPLRRMFKSTEPRIRKLTEELLKDAVILKDPAEGAPGPPKRK